MDDKTIQRKLNQLCKIANELGDEAHKRWPDGELFYESEGRFYIMDGDSLDGCSERQKHIKFSSKVFCNMGCGAW